jgi:hypothetical protein
MHGCPAASRLSAHCGATRPRNAPSQMSQSGRLARNFCVMKVLALLLKASTSM